jgi:hypothetical protein
MHCPQCGQAALVEGVKFCSRCGFALEGVKELLTPGAHDPDQWRQALRRGLKFAGFGAGLALLGFILGFKLVFFKEYLFPPGSPWRELLVPLEYLFIAIYFVAPFFGLYGLWKILYALFWLRRSSVPQSSFTTSNLNEAHAPHALPPQQSIPVNLWPQNAQTAEMAPPPSVTENTTALLFDEPQPPR